MENQAEDPNALSAHYVGASFSEGYYKMLHMHPDLVHRFYDDPSDPDNDTKSASTVRGINKVMRSLNVKDYSPKIRTVDSQFSHNDGVIVLVTGSFEGTDESKKFSQTFFLASRASADGKKLYFVLNDIFRFDNDDCSPPTPAAAAELTTVVEEAAPVEVVAEKAAVVAENGHHEAEENSHAAENGGAESPVESVKTEEAPLANGGTEEAEAVVPAPKKSFASVVSALKLNAAPFQMRAPQLKPVEQHRARAPVAPKPEPVGPAPALAPAPAVNGSVQKNTESAPPAKSHAIFVANLPMTATVDELDKVFKQFGTIKHDGIQVRSSKQLGTCFGFVEYESASSMQSALEASPVVFGARKLSIEERRATNDRPKFSSGRGGGYRSDNYRGGRGNFNGNNRGYGRNEFSGRGRGNGNNAPRNNVIKEEKPAATPDATVKA